MKLRSLTWRKELKCHKGNWLRWTDWSVASTIVSSIAVGKVYAFMVWNCPQQGRRKIVSTKKCFEKLNCRVGGDAIDKAHRIASKEYQQITVCFNLCKDSTSVYKNYKKVENGARNPQIKQTTSFLHFWLSTILIGQELIMSSHTLTVTLPRLLRLKPYSLNWTKMSKFLLFPFS